MKTDKRIMILFVLVGIMFASLIVFEQKGNIVGKAFLSPVQVYGEIIPPLPDNIIISFKVGDLEILSTKVINSSFGYQEKIYFTMDDSATIKKEGYSRGDSVSIFIEDINIAEASYFGEMPKIIEIPVSLRTQVINKAAGIINCRPEWQCTDWTECNNKDQTRECIDKNNCRVPIGQPDELKVCKINVGYEIPYSNENPIVYAIAAIFIALVCVIFITFTILKKK